MSKVTAPSELALNVYYWFSYVTMIFTWLITPLMIYIIFSQSKQLKSFKWFIFNHLLWCLMYETWLGLMKPIVLSPKCAGYFMGLLEATSMSIATAGTFLSFAICMNCVIGLAATIACRYALVFPTTLFKWLNMKIIAIGALGIMIMSAAVTGICGYLVLQATEASTYTLAAQHDYSLVFYFSKNSFVFVPFDYCIFGIRSIFTILAIVAVIFLATIGYFLTLVKTFDHGSVDTSLQYSLIMSSVVQMLITCLFLIFPALGFMGSLAFQISDTTDVYIYCKMLFLMHCIIEYIATLYFVKPYRIYVKNIFLRIGKV